MTRVPRVSSFRGVIALLCGVATLVPSGCDRIGPAAVVSSRTCGSAFDLVDGDGQPGEVGQPLSKQLVVQTRVTAGTAQCSERAAPNEPIRWVAATGGGTVSPASSSTDAAGAARTTWTVGPQLGTQTVTAQWLDAVTGTVRGTQSFSATVYSTPYRVLRKLTGDAQSAAPGARLALPPTVVLMTVAEAGAQQPKRETPIQLVQIQWTVTGGAGSIDRLSTPTAQDGRASVAWTLGNAAGPQALRAVAPVASQDPRDTLEVVFTATATPVPVSSITLAPEADVTLQVGQTMPFTARTFGGTPAAELPGRAVTWTASSAAIADVSSLTGTSPSTITVTGRAVGTADISASSEGQTASRRVTVVAPPPRPLRIAYGLANQPQVASYAAASAFSSSGGAITVTRQATGVYRVTFVGQQPAAGETETVLVSRYGEGNHYCKLAGEWTNGPATDLVADVRCFTYPGGSVDAAFSIMLIGEATLSGRFGFGLANQPSAPGPYTPARSYNSGSPSAGPVSVTRVGTGHYTVSFPGNAGGPNDPEAVHVTAVGPTNVRCNIAEVVQETVRVRCYAPTNSTPMDSPFTIVLLDRGRGGDMRSGYAWTADPSGEEFEQPGVFVLSSTRAYSSSQGAVELTKLGEVGRYDVLFRGLAPPGATPILGVQVVNRDADEPMFCNVVGWTVVAQDLRVTVQCWHSDDGEPEDESFYLIVLQ